MADSDTYDVLRMADQSNFQHEKMHYITKEKNNI